MDRHERLTARRDRLGATAWLVVALTLAAHPALAQESTGSTGDSAPGLLARAGVTGSIRAGFWSSTQNLDAEDNLGAGMLWLKSSRQLSPRVSFLVEGWTALRGPAGDGDFKGELREGYATFKFGRLDVRAGRQIVAWGRADGINPTDNLTGEDFTLLAPDDDDRRFGTTAVRASYYVGDVSVTGFWLPEFRGNRIPLPPAPGLSFVHESPDWPADQWALRVEQTGRAVDWSASYYQGRDLMPDLGPGLAPASSARGASVSLSHHRVRVLGGDMAANVGRIGLRAEGAYVDTEDDGGRDPYTKNPYLFIVVGGDRTFQEYLNVNVQYIYRQVFDHRRLDGLPPAEAGLAALQGILNNQTRRVQHGASFRVAHKWLRETLEGECAAVGYFGPQGLALQPKLAYAVSDHWKLLVGAQVYRGETASVFGLLRSNSTGYVEARWSF